MKISVGSVPFATILIAFLLLIASIGYYLWEVGDRTGNPDDDGNGVGSDLTLDLEDVVLTRSYWTDAGLVEPPWYISGGTWTSSGHDDIMWAYGPYKDVIVPLEWENDTMWAWDGDKGRIVRHTYFLFLKINVTNTGDEDIDLSGRYLLYGIDEFASYYYLHTQPLVLNRSETDPRYVSDTPITSDLLLSPSDSITGWFITSVNDTISERDTITIGFILGSDGSFPSSGGIEFPSLEVGIGNARVYESIQPRLSMEVVQHTFNDSIDGYQPSPGNRFVVVDLVLRTEWDFDMMVRAEDISLVDDGNETYGVSPASEGLPDHEGSQRFGSSRELSMSLVFEVPISSGPALLLLEDYVSVEAVI